MKREISSDSLSGQNVVGRNAGLGSSPSRSTKTKTKLWKKLRKLDKKCALFVRNYKWYMNKESKECLYAYNKYLKFDQKRKEVRMKLKSLWKN